jgi:hypothetical protein
MSIRIQKIAIFKKLPFFTAIAKGKNNTKTVFQNIGIRPFDSISGLTLIKNKNKKQNMIR